MAAMSQVTAKVVADGRSPTRRSQSRPLRRVPCCAVAVCVSFLLGVPAIAAAGLHEIWELARFGQPLNGWTTLGVGLVVSSLSSFLAIWGLMRFLERFSTWPLVIYRALFGVLLIGGVYAGWF